MDVEADDGDDAGEAGEGEEVFAPGGRGRRVFHL